MKYRTIAVDPPWAYPEGDVTQSHSKKWIGPLHREPWPYPSLSLDEIAALPIGELAEPDARLFLWATNRYLPAALPMLGGWGFTYRQTLVWHKRDNTMAGSVAPNAEFLLVAQRGTPGRLGTLRSAVILTSQPKRHSAKPECFLDYIEQVSPGPYLELFARRNRLGWDTWGNESLEHVSIGEPGPGGGGW